MPNSNYPTGLMMFLSWFNYFIGEFLYLVFKTSLHDISFILSIICSIVYIYKNLKEKPNEKIN
jgi:hypothetical protein